MPKIPLEITYEKYVLRATFFLGKLHSLGFFGLFEDIKKIASDHKEAFSWNKKEKWGVTEDAWKEIEEEQIDPLLVFAHPKILKIHPKFLRYYRSISLVPVKGFKAISGLSNTERVEEGRATIADEKIVAVVQALNQIMSLLVVMVSGFDESKIRDMMFTSAGATLQGSWCNAVGQEGERVIRSFILESLLENNEVTAFTNKDGKSTKIEDWVDRDPIAEIETIRSITVKNGSMILFASEPDIQLMDQEGIVLGGVEVKAGIDPAAALERHGGMLKSFENILVRYPDADTILVAACITKEVETRLAESRSVKQSFVLTDIINNKNGRRDIFTNSVRSILGLIEKRM